MAAIKASPLAKKIAAEKGINISQIQGSGDGGRIIKSDIDNYKPAAAAKQNQVLQRWQASATSAGQVSFDEVPVYTNA